MSFAGDAGREAIIPIEDACRDYFSHLINATKLVQNAKAVQLTDFAKYLDPRVRLRPVSQTAQTEQSFS